MRQHQVDTLNVMDVDKITVDLWYPRVEGRYKNIEISLMDVRAANNINVSYDFERDGWVISSNLHDPDEKWWERTQEELDEISNTPPKLVEVAFIPAWPLKGSKDD